jgi:hypothetical protein
VKATLELARAVRHVAVPKHRHRGQMMPGGIEAGWEVTPETMAGM